MRGDTVAGKREYTRHTRQVLLGHSLCLDGLAQLWLVFLVVGVGVATGLCTDSLAFPGTASPVFANQHANKSLATLFSHSVTAIPNITSARGVCNSARGSTVASMIY